VDLDPQLLHVDLDRRILLHVDLDLILLHVDLDHRILLRVDLDPQLLHVDLDRRILLHVDLDRQLLPADLDHRLLLVDLGPLLLLETDLPEAVDLPTTTQDVELLLADVLAPILEFLAQEDLPHQDLLEITEDHLKVMAEEHLKVMAEDLAQRTSHHHTQNQHHVQPTPHTELYHHLHTNLQPLTVLLTSLTSHLKLKEVTDLLTDLAVMDLNTLLLHVIML